MDSQKKSRGSLQGVKRGSFFITVWIAALSTGGYRCTCLERIYSVRELPEVSTLLRTPAMSFMLYGFTIVAQNPNRA